MADHSRHKERRAFPGHLSLKERVRHAARGSWRTRQAPLSDYSAVTCAAHPGDFAKSPRYRDPFFQSALGITNPAMAQSFYDTKTHLYPALRQTTLGVVPVVGRLPFEVTAMPITPANQVVAQPVNWLWPGRLPLGKLVLMDGDPDLGKSLLALDLCARLSTGRPFPDGQPGPGALQRAGAQCRGQRRRHDCAAAATSGCRPGPRQRRPTRRSARGYQPAVFGLPEPRSTNSRAGTPR